MSEMRELIAESIDDLQKVAKEIIAFGREVSVWLFLGEMGAGKTTTIQAVCEVFGVMDTVQSPTFSIVNEYQTEKEETIYHFDFYRIEEMEEALSIGVDEYFDSGNRCLIEWPQKVEVLLPDQFLRIDIEADVNERRIFKLRKNE